MKITSERINAALTTCDAEQLADLYRAADNAGHGEAPGTTRDDQDREAGIRHLLDLDGWAAVDHDPGTGADDDLTLLEDCEGLIWIIGDQNGIWGVPGDLALRDAFGDWETDA